MSFSSWPGYGSSGHGWTPESSSSADTSSPSPYLARPLGILETKFDKAAQQNGLADTFLRLRCTLPSIADSTFFGRLPLAWAALRARHPSLASSVHDAPEGKYQGIPLVQTREFRYWTPASDEEAVRHALETILVEPSDDVEAAMERVLDKKILNGPRVLLDQASCLGRLLIFRDTKDGGVRVHGLFLLISHVVRPSLPSSLEAS